MHKILFYNKFIICLYMFQALCDHHLEVKLCYTASGIVPSGAQVERGLCTGRPPTGAMIPDVV